MMRATLSGSGGRGGTSRAGALDAAATASTGASSLKAIRGCVPLGEREVRLTVGVDLATWPEEQVAILADGKPLLRMAEGAALTLADDLTRKIELARAAEARERRSA